LLIDADAAHGGPSIEMDSQGSARDTHQYCGAVLDIEALGGAMGVLTVKGAPTADLAAPQFDELPPMHIDVPKGTVLRQRVSVNLRRNLTYFYWDTSHATTHGPFHLWVTATVCPPGSSKV
jgi:hypothetical protein